MHIILQQVKKAVATREAWVWCWAHVYVDQGRVVFIQYLS